MRDTRKATRGKKVSIEEALAKETSARAARSRRVTKSTHRSGIRLGQGLLSALGLGGAAHPIRRLQNPGGRMEFPNFFQKPALNRIPFGKHRGEMTDFHANPATARPSDYEEEFLLDLMRNSGMNSDVRNPFMRARGQYEWRNQQEFQDLLRILQGIHRPTRVQEHMLKDKFPFNLN